MPAPAPLVWFHVPGESRLAAAEELARRLADDLPDVTSLATVATLPADRQQGPITYISPPPDTRGDALAFLADWTPTAVVWFGAQLRLRTLAEVEAQRLPAFMVDARASDLNLSRLPHRRVREKAALRSFSRILTVDESASDALKALGVGSWKLEVSGPVVAGSMALPHNEAERSFMAETLATRPVWYAAGLPSGELTVALDAHRALLRRAHRFLLVISPSDLADADAMASAVAEAGFRVVRRSEADEVDPEDQVLIADLKGEDGLWYRLAPLTFLGGTFSGSPNRNPFEPAALGSAILHGPRIRHHAPNFARLRAAGGSREVNGPGELGPALSTLSSPDQGARLAHAAWDVSSSGAQVTDRILALLTRALGEG
ncbi:MAG: glycosyltransferase N-terminal domain-containing protein [Pseudomonadota bacterium]